MYRTVIIRLDYLYCSDLENAFASILSTVNKLEDLKRSLALFHNFLAQMAYGSIVEDTAQWFAFDRSVRSSLRSYESKAC